MTLSDYNYRRRVKRLLARFGLKPRNIDLYCRAFTHPSVAQKPSESYELLEFLGDSVILLHVVKALVKRYPVERVGLLSKAKSQIVSGDALGKIAKELKFENYIRLDESILKNSRSISPGIMADVFEAFVGAIYKDLGYLKVNQFLKSVLCESLSIDLQKRRESDYKSILQEEVQRKYKQIPTYKLVRSTGPDHAKTFYVRVTFLGVNMGKGMGKCKKEAEQDAACKTLKRLDHYFKNVDKSNKILRFHS